VLRLVSAVQREMRFLDRPCRWPRVAFPRASKMSARAGMWCVPDGGPEPAAAAKV